MPKFDIAIMNPPWETKTDLHVKIVKNILDNCEDLYYCYYNNLIYFFYKYLYNMI